MYLNSKNFEQKYKKYKDRYLELKNQLTDTLSGGECVILPDPEEEDFTTQNLLDLCPGERITIQNKCYNIKSLYEWIFKQNKNTLPSTQTEITVQEKKKLEKEYKLLLYRYKYGYIYNQRKLPEYISYSQLPINVTIDSSNLTDEIYEEEIREIYNTQGLDMFEIPFSLTEDIYNQLIKLTRRIIKISGFGKRPDIDNIFLTVSDPGTGRYNIDIWKIYSSTQVPLALDKKMLIKNIYHLNIGNWNVVKRNEYIMFASNINISLRRDLEPIELENLTFEKALLMGIHIEIKSLVHRYDTDSDIFYFNLWYNGYDCNIGRITFYNPFSNIIKNRYSNPSGNTPRGARGYNAYWD